jgi:hypothetical protein
MPKRHLGFYDRHSKPFHLAMRHGAGMFRSKSRSLTSPNRQVGTRGSGKGLLVRAICTIAFGVRPRAFTAGSERQELDKRLAAELIEAQPVLFLDNANGIALRSDTLASVLTERPARVRLLGQTRMVPLNSIAFVAITGNGLTVTEDLARRSDPLTCTISIALGHFGKRWYHSQNA